MYEYIFYIICQQLHSVQVFTTLNSKLMLLVMLLSIHKYVLKFRVFATEIDKLESLSSDHSFI